jgi:transcriptional regulator with XRE-family HTH domain
MKTRQIRREGRHAPYDRVLLRQRRIAAGLSQVRLAQLTGLSTSLISALECGTSGASPATLTRIATVLRCTLNDLGLPESA